MPDFAFTGKKGTGKSKNAVRTIRDEYLSRGLRVATNLDVYLEPMFGPYSRRTYIRLPDKPSAFDLQAAGHGNPDNYDEELNGGMFLDELGTWFNTRTFSDKGRADSLDYLAHGRKHGWNMYYLMQNIVQVDKQLRESFIEYTVRHTRFDRVRVPFVGWIIQALLGKKAGYLPRFHRAVARLGTNPTDIVTDSAMFRGDDLNACYDTRQVFQHDYPHGTHSVLSPWHVTGRYLPPQRLPFLVRLLNWWRSKPQPPAVPLSRPSPAFARVVAMARRLPPDQAAAIVARYARAERLRSVRL